MEIEWKYSLETEARRVVHTARQMAVGFYRLNGFYVLPYSLRNFNFGGNPVYFPELEYRNIPRFWEKVKKINVYHIPFEIDPVLLQQLMGLMNPADFPEPNIDKANEIWEKMEGEFWETLGMVIPDLKNSVTGINVYPTRLGTKCSFNVIEKFPAELNIYLRNDQDIIYGLVEGILSAITRDKIYKNLESSWQESEMLVDWLISESAIGKVVGKYHDLKFYSPTMKSIRGKQSAKILKESEKFYRKLGLPSFDKPFSIEENMPRLWQKPVSDLTPQENVVLSKLISNQNQVTSMDELAQVISGNDEDFSLYAISKTIQRIRDKLELNGLSGGYIQTMRGKGYVLRN